MKINFTKNKKERIIQYYNENLKKEIERTRKHLEITKISGSNVIASELQERLVQVCIDYIKETGNTKIGRVMFTVDNLQESAKYGSWQPCTDSSCEVEEMTNNGYELISYSV